MEAVGILEVYGLTCAFLAADAGCKAGNVWLENFDRNKPANAESLPVPLIIAVKFRGRIADVEAAMQAAGEKAASTTGIIQKHIIPSPVNELMLKINSLESLSTEPVIAENVITENFVCDKTESFGFVELSGVVASTIALDTMCKLADVQLIGRQKRLGGRLVTIIIEGSVSAVNEAVYSVDNPAAAGVIANPHFEIINMVRNFGYAKYE